MKLHCLLITNSQHSVINKLTLAKALTSVKGVNIFVEEWDGISDSVVKHADILIVDGNMLSSIDEHNIAAHCKLHFDSTLIVTEAQITPADANLRHLAFPTSVGAIKNWLEQKVTQKQTVKDIDTLTGHWQLDLLSHLKTDHFQANTAKLGKHYQLLLEAKNQGKDGILSVLEQFDDINKYDLITIVDLFLSLRMFNCYKQMNQLYASLHPILQNLDLLKEQVVFARNRMAKTIEEKQLLVEILETISTPSSETLAIIGRIYKDCWSISVDEEDEAQQRYFLNTAIYNYQQASYLDTRDTYPAINYATLLRIRSNEGDLAEMRAVLDCLHYNLKVTTTVFDPESFAKLDELVGIKATGKRTADYWDTATAFEMYVLRQHQDKVWQLKDKLIKRCSEKWMLATTLHNLYILSQHNAASPTWLASIIESLSTSLTEFEKGLN